MLSYDELSSTITEVEMMVNSRSISYLSIEDIEEALVPSHLLIGKSLSDAKHCWDKEIMWRSHTIV